MAHRHLCFRICKSFGRRSISTEHAVLPELDDKVKNDIESERIKPKKHPGIMKIGCCSLPPYIVDAIKIVAEDHPVSTILSDAKTLANYLFSRHYPWEEEELSERRAGFVEDVKQRIGTVPEDASEEQIKHYNNIVKNSVAQLMSKYSYNWSPLELQDYSSLVYLFTRGAANYAAAMRVFHEIIKQCPDFRPTSLFDFGSGVGSVSWAAKSCWEESIKLFVNIDSSSSMNDLAELLLKGGNPDVGSPTNVFYRQFLPAQNPKHSLVVCAHSLMELPSRQSRLDLMLNLWNKTQDFLIIIEQGTKPGFRLVLEARDFILSLNNEKSSGYVFAPCPHDVACPRFIRGPYPCHLQVSYLDLDIGKKHHSKKELLSYVIIKRGKRPEGKDWPRVVRPVLQRHNHVVCRLCTAQGELKEIIFTKNKHGKTLYTCAKKTNWGDYLPVSLESSPAEKSENLPEPDQKMTDNGFESKPPD